MIEHESDLWPERRWAIDLSGLRAYPFRSAKERNDHVAANAMIWRAVGKRHPAVKRLRQQWRQEALTKLAEWKEQHR